MHADCTAHEFETLRTADLIDHLCEAHDAAKALAAELQARIGRAWAARAMAA